MKAFVTGIFGFVGKHLTNKLIAMGHEVDGFALSQDIEVGVFPSKVQITEGDLCDTDKLSWAIRRSGPDTVFHLAALSSVKLSFENPTQTFMANVMGTLNVLEAVSRLKRQAKVLLVSSSEIYGQLGPDDVPVKETAPLAPVNPYGVSKAACDLMGYQYFKAYGMPVYRVRAFSHCGPAQGTQAVLSDWAFQVARIELGLAAPQVKVGNLNVSRDYTDVRDIIEAYLAVIDKGVPGEAYNVCSGKGYLLEELLTTITSFSSKKIKIIVDQSRLRPVDIPILIGSSEKLRRDTGWRPAIDIKVTLKDMYEHWLNDLKNETPR